MDPLEAGSGYPLDRVPIPGRPPAMPAAPEPVQSALIAYARSLEEIMAGYHIVDRNYTYEFHNYLFMRHTPLLANYRTVALRMVADARRLRDAADVQATPARAALADDDPLAALLDDVRGYTAFIFDRAPTLD